MRSKIYLTPTQKALIDKLLKKQKQKREITQSGIKKYIL